MEIELLEGEIFKPVVHKGVQFEYEISNKGRLVSFKKSEPFLMTPSQEPGRCGRPGYLSTGLRYPDKSKNYSVRIHILVGRAFLANPDNLKELNHEDGDKTNNNDWNLKWSTHLYNIQHSFSTGLVIRPKGNKSHLFDKGRKVILNGIIYNSVAGAARASGRPRPSLSGELRGDRENKSGIAYAN